MTYSLFILRQISAGLLACAVKELFPRVQLIQAKATNAGFFCDFSLETSLDRLALPLLEEEMRRIAKKAPYIRLFDMMKENAVAFFSHHGCEIQAIRAEQVTENILTLFQVGNTYDFLECGELALELSEELQKTPCFRLMQAVPAKCGISSEEAMPVQRVKGIVFETQKELRKGVKQWDSAREFDHWTLGPELGLFSVGESGEVTWMAKGVALKTELAQLWQKWHASERCQIVQTPELYPEDQVQSWNSKRAAMRQKLLLPAIEIQGVPFCLRPNLESGHVDWYRRAGMEDSGEPVSVAEIGRIFRQNAEYDRGGLYAQNVYTADEAHVICRRAQLEEEIIYSLHFFEKFIKIFDLKYRWYLRCTSKEGSEFVGLEKVLASALTTCGIVFDTRRGVQKVEAPGIDVCIFDGYGLEWTGPSLEVVTLKSQKNAIGTKEKQNATPLFAIKRTLFTYLERFVALLVENYQGKFPLWLAPEQIRIIPVGAGNYEGARKAKEQIQAKGFKASVDESSQRLGAKIHVAELERVPYIVIIGDVEEQRGVVSVRAPSSHKEKCEVKLELFLEEIRDKQ